MGDITLPLNFLVCRMFLLLVSVLSFAAVPCMANGSDGQSLRHMMRELEEDIDNELPAPEDIVNDIPEVDLPTNQETPDIPTVDRNGDGVFYNPCSLCQGLDFQADKVIANPLLSNITCGEANYLAENQPETLGTSYDSCRSSYVFNVAFEACCRPSIPVYECEQNIHNSFDESDYNTAVPPIVSFDPEDSLNVTVHFTYQALEKIAVEEGTATIFVTIVMIWNDPRLAWNVEGDKCANVVTTWTGHEIEKTKIWIPDFTLYNEIEGMQTMPEFKAHVYADGTVLWSISGGLSAFCAYRDLARIPFDTLGCQYLFGASTREHTGSIKYILQDPDYLLFGGFETTYNEWRVVPERGEQGTAFDGMAIYYNIYLKRSTQHYIQNIVIPTIILTYLSFFTFLLDLRVGERLGFGMALALVVVAQQIVTSGMTPISDQRLWLDKFVGWSFYWVLVGVIESVLIGFLFYVREDKAAKDEAKDKAKRQQQYANAEELEPLSMGTIEETKPTGTDSEPISAKDSFIVAVWNLVIYKMPIRKVDILALIGCTLTYTIFIVIMFSTAVTDVWLQDEPMWFDESSGVTEMGGMYVNGDPEN